MRYHAVKVTNVTFTFVIHDRKGYYGHFLFI